MSTCVHPSAFFLTRGTTHAAFQTQSFQVGGVLRKDNINLIMPGDEHDKEGSSQSAENSSILAELRSMKTSLSSSINAISARVDGLSQTVYASGSAAQGTAETGSRSWADSCKSPPLRLLRWQGDGSRSEDEEEDAQHEPSSVIQLAETDQEIVQNAFSTTLTNVERRRVRNSFGTADLPNTRCPRLDPVFKASIAKASEAKAMDAELARIQAFVLDPVAPLTNLLAQVEDENFTGAEAKVVVHDALHLLGNASNQISKIRRKRVLKALNPKMQDMADEGELFQTAAPLLCARTLKAN